MAHYPRSVYAIFPFDQCGKVAGVYVGSTYRVDERISRHLGTHRNCGKQTLMHDLMRNNGFQCFILGTIQNWNENHIEYDWIDYFDKETDLALFNNRTGLCGADWRRIGGEEL